MTETLRARRQAARREQILDVALAIAERDGWAAVTTRGLAQEIGYTQPVIYQHFASRSALVDAVVQRGFTRLTALIDDQASRGLEGVIRAYVAFGRDQRALYEAMFSREVSIRFAAPDTPDALRGAFTSLEAVLGEHGPVGHRQTRAELFWASCHGLVSLINTARIPEDHLEGLITALLRTADVASQ